MNRIVRITAVGIAVLMPVIALAGEFTVTPVRIFMTPRDRAVAVTIANEGDTDLVMQAELFAWGQKPGGQDDLKPTEDVVMAPPIMKVPAKSRQVLRLVRLSPPPADEEQTFRLVVREIPDANPKGEGVQMQMAVAFSMPVFITPRGARRQLSCTPARAQSGKLVALCENTGTAYAQVRSLTLLRANGDAAASSKIPVYLLPRIKRTVELDGADPVPAGIVKLVATMDDGTSQAFEGSFPD